MSDGFDRGLPWDRHELPPADKPKSAFTARDWALLALQRPAAISDATHLLHVTDMFSAAMRAQSETLEKLITDGFQWQDATGCYSPEIAKAKIADLRAQLAETEKALSDEGQRGSNICMEWSDLVDDLRAKLAVSEAERDRLRAAENDGDDG